MKNIGFIGVGVMGKSMVLNLIRAGFNVHIYARNVNKVAEVIDKGAIFHPSIRECIEDCDVVITMVGFPQDVEEVYFASNNIFENAKPGTYLIDMTTTSPTLAEHLYQEGTNRGFHLLDAPVTGGDAGARNGTLSILVGGDKEDFDTCLPVFKAMGNNINYHGKAGCGQHAKMANQIMIAGTLSGLCEALSYAISKDLDLPVFLNSVASGAAGSKQLDLYAQRIVSGDFAPGFFLKHFVKDLGLAVEEAKKSGLCLEILKQTYQNSKELECFGYGDYGNHILMKHYDKFSC